jgi:hypothetical protein
MLAKNKPQGQNETRSVLVDTTQALVFVEPTSRAFIFGLLGLQSLVFAYSRALIHALRYF